MNAARSITPRPDVPRRRGGQPGPMRIPAGHIGVRDLADLVGRSVATVQHWHASAASRATETGDWPTWLIPRPDSPPGSRPVTWRAARQDVKRFVGEKRRAPRPALLDDPVWLREQYGHPDGAGGRPVVPGGKARTLLDLARETGASRPTVRNALLRHGILVPDDAAHRGLTDVSLEELERVYEEEGSIVRAAARLGVSHMTFRAELRRKRLIAGRAVEGEDVTGR